MRVGVRVSEGGHEVYCVWVWYIDVNVMIKDAGVRV